MLFLWEWVNHVAKFDKSVLIIVVDNYKAVNNAIKGMTDKAMFSISPAKISVSTVGVVPRIL